MSVTRTPYTRNYFLTPAENGYKPPVTELELSKLYANNPKTFGTVLYEEVEDSLFSELIVKDNQFYFKANQVTWEEQQPSYNANIVSGVGVVSFDSATGEFTINNAAIVVDASDINSERPTSAQWLQVKVGMEFTAYDANGKETQGVITSISEDKQTFTATPKGGAWTTGFGAEDVTILFNGNNLEGCELAPRIGFNGYKAVRENTMHKDSEGVEYCEEIEAENGMDGGDATPYAIGSDEYNVDYRLKNAQKLLLQRMENRFVTNKRLTVAEANGGRRGTEGVLQTVEKRALKYGKISTKADLMNVFANMRMKKIKFATLRCSDEQYQLLTDLLDTTNFQNAFTDNSNSLVQIGFAGFKFGDQTILFKRWDLLDYYPNIGKKYHWILIPDGKLTVKLNGQVKQAGYLNIGWFEDNASGAYNFLRVEKGDVQQGTLTHGKKSIDYVVKCMPIVLRPEDWMLGYTPAA